MNIFIPTENKKKEKKKKNNKTEYSKYIETNFFFWYGKRKCEKILTRNLFQ